MRIKNVFVVLLIIFIISCAPTVPVVNGHQYIGRVTQITVTPAYQRVTLDNGTDYATMESVTVGDYVYRNRYGQLKLISPE